MDKVYQAVKSNHKAYLSLLNDLKFITTDTISVDRKEKNRPNKLVCDLPVEHVSIKDDNVLTIESVINDGGKFRFKLRCEPIFEKHYFRFDSFGPNHRNKNPKKPFKSVETPHFNKFDEDGYNVAYRTDKIVNLNSNWGIKEYFLHFCEEANILQSGEGEIMIEVGDKSEIKFPITGDRIMSVKFTE